MRNTNLQKRTTDKHLSVYSQEVIICISILVIQNIVQPVPVGQGNGGSPTILGQDLKSAAL